jgi:cytosine/adenosine deaminase-related metal-dependent hydrolase
MSVDPAHRTTLRAGLLFPGDGTVLRDALLVIEGDRVAEYQAARQHVADIDLRDAAIIPPLVNAHTHLEFSALEHPIPAGSSFADWIRAVIDVRSRRQPYGPRSTASIQRGLAQSRRFGCLQIAEIATTTDDPSDASDEAVGGIQFLELLGITTQRAAAQLSVAEDFLRSREKRSSGRFRAGLSPHAPYSTSMRLVEGAVAISRKYDAPVAMHLAESQEEMRLLARQDGPLADFLIERRIWPPPHIGPTVSAMDYLKLLAEAPLALVIHGNYLSAAERSFVASRPQMSIVYCPRTHAHFGHPKYPLAETIGAGARVALGTDSCASNPDLNIWAEAQFVARHHPTVSPAKVLALVTTDAAEAIGSIAGSIEPGGPANFSVIAGLPAQWSARPDPFATLLADSTYPDRVWSYGREIQLS